MVSCTPALNVGPNGVSSSKVPNWLSLRVTSPEQPSLNDVVPGQRFSEMLPIEAVLIRIGLSILRKKPLI